MQVVMFSFRPEVTKERQDTVLDQVRVLDGVVSADRLFGAGPTPEIRGMCYAYVSDDIDLSALVEHLQNIPEIISAFIPPPRGLIL